MPGLNMSENGLFVESPAQSEKKKLSRLRQNREPRGSRASKLSNLDKMLLSCGVTTTDESLAHVCEKDETEKIFQIEKTI